MASLESIRTFSKKFHQLETRLDILINNAGVLTNEKRFTEDGFELHMGVNYLGHFLLTNLLLDMLRTSAPSRIINVSSMAHKMHNLDRENLMSDRDFSKFRAYGRSKLAIILFTKELSRKLEGTKVTVNTCHPGFVQTEINGKYAKSNILIKLIATFVKTPLEGAQTHIKLAVDPKLQTVSGKYFSHCKEDETSADANIAETARWLWEESSILVALDNV